MSRYNSKKVDNVKVMLKAGADGVGIVSIEKTSTQGLVDTYTITLSNGIKTTIQVTNGNGIESIEKTATQGRIDTYTITFTDGTTTTYQVTNGADTNASIAEKVTSPATKPYRIGDYVVFNDSLCEVSAPIDIGDDFEIDTNLEITTVMSEVEARSSQIFNTTGMLNRNMLSPDRLNVALENVNVGEVGSIDYGYGGYNSFIAKVEPYTDYIVSCADESFITRIIVGLTDLVPAEDGTFICAVNESTDREATFNSGNHEWAIFYMNAGYGRNPISSLSPMLKLATDLDPTYEAPTKNISELLKDLGQAQNDMIKNAVGWYGKNLLPLNINTLKALNGSDSYWTWSNNEASTDGIILDFTVDENDMVTAIRLVRSGIYEQGYRSFKLINNLSDYLVDGEEYILSGSEGGSYSSYGIYNGTRGTWESYEGESEPTVYRNTWNDLLIDIAPVLIDETFLYPMVRNASVNDSTFEVYHESVKDYLGTASTKNSTSVVTESSDLVESGAVKDIVGWGNKNLCPMFKDSVINSVTFTVDKNGVITATGTATGGAGGVVSYFTTKKSRMVIANGCNSGNPKIQIFPYCVDDNARPYTDETKTARLTSNDNVYNGNELPFYIEQGKTYYLGCRVLAGETVNGQKFYPMIRDANITDATYEPYHESVSESLAEKVGWDKAEGYVGKNLYNNTETGMASSVGSVTLNNNGGYTLKGTEQYTSSKNILKRCEKGKKYFLSAKIISSNASDLRLGIRNSSNTFIESIIIGTNTGTYTVPFTYSNGYYVALTFNFSGASAEKTIVCEEIMVQEEGTPSDYVTFIPSNTELSETKADNSVIGNTETAASSTHAYSAGQSFICDGQFRVAKGSGIAVGEQITDSNSDVKPIADLIAPLNDTLTSSNGTIEASRIYTCGKLVSYMIRFKATEDIPAGTNIINGIKLTAVVNSGMVTALFTDISTGDTYRVNLDVSANIPRLKTLDAIANGTTIRGSITYISQ